jgi:hypothetical protein
MASSPRVLSQAMGMLMGTRPWTPLDLDTGGKTLVRFWDGSDATSFVLGSGGAVQQWKDKSSYADVGVGPAGAQPVYNASGDYGVDYGAGGTQLNPSSLTGLPLGAVASTMFAVATSGGYDNYQAFGYGGGDYSARCIGHGSNGRPSFGVFGTGVDVANGPGDWPGNKWIVQIHTAGDANNTTTFTINGTNYGGTTSFPLTTNTNNGAGLGWWPSYGPTWENKIFAVIICNRVLTQAETDQLQGWAAWTFNLVSQLPANHPYKTAAPTVTVASSGTAFTGSIGLAASPAMGADGGATGRPAVGLALTARVTAAGSAVFRALVPLATIAALAGSISALIARPAAVFAGVPAPVRGSLQPESSCRPAAWRPRRPRPLPATGRS